MRIDRLLVFLRFARTRSRARNLIEEGHIRHNGKRVQRSSDEIRVGDVLTLPLGSDVKIVEVLGLPERRGPPLMAKSHYRMLDRGAENAIATSHIDD